MIRTREYCGKFNLAREEISNGLTPIWEDGVNDNADGMDNVAKSAAKYMIVLDLNSSGVNQSYIAYFKSHVMSRVREDPLFCKTPECLSNSNQTAGIFARHLHDTFYAYGLGLTREPTYYHDAANITLAINGNFTGLTGEVQMTANNTRVAEYMLYYLDSSFQQQIYMKMLCAKVAQMLHEFAAVQHIVNAQPS
ncbi:hypothetical protein NECAME_17530 [Necator americanus]|uniref:Uncharacterized protein n=1 Tax=Necator americanus TaxID=51031 RepID=W2TQ93_NECAM|nr:hypothetical protein NECAME_17530 [Necator americanus]ETN83266.1 hypothetical protein NECAME_17530 [Necator americanus]